MWSYWTYIENFPKRCSGYVPLILTYRGHVGHSDYAHFGSVRRKQNTGGVVSHEIPQSQKLPAPILWKISLTFVLLTLVLWKIPRITAAQWPCLVIVSLEEKSSQVEYNKPIYMPSSINCLQLSCLVSHGAVRRLISSCARCRDFKHSSSVWHWNSRELERQAFTDRLDPDQQSGVQQFG